MGNYWLPSVPFWAVTGVGGWGAEDALTEFFSFSPSCDVLSSFFSLPFFCCFFSFLKRCFSSFVKSFPSFCFTKQKRKHDRQPKTGLTQDLDKFKHEPSLARCHRSRESFLQNCQQNKHLITPRTDVCFTIRLWTSQTAPPKQTSRSATLVIRSSNFSYS